MELKVEDFNQAYSELRDFFTKNPIDCPLSELHGMILGYQVADNDACFKTWSNLVRDDVELNSLPEKVSDQIKQLFLYSHIQICQTNIQTDLLIPQENTPFLQKLKALADFSRGFLYGFGVAGSSIKLLAKPQIREILNDMTQFSQVDVHQDQDSNYENDDFNQILNYLKSSLAQWKQLCAEPEMTTDRVN